MGGSIVTNQENVKHQVSVQLINYPVSNGHICGGVIITNKKVLTAAHCLFYDDDDGTSVLIHPSEFRIAAGILQLNSSPATAFTSSVSNITVHENYNPFTMQNDIAIMEISSSFPENNQFISTVQLRKTAVGTGTICQVTGWGRLFYVSIFRAKDSYTIHFHP